MSHRVAREDTPPITRRESELTKTPDAGAVPERDARGRFVKGNRGGPGNPFARRTARMRQAFHEAVSEEDLVEVARTITRKAKEGDMAAKLLLLYLVGKPDSVVEPDTLDLQEIQQYESEVRHYNSLPAVAARPDLGLACTIARATRPVIAEVASRDLEKALIDGEFPEGSPFAPAEDFDCQELTGSDTPPSVTGGNGAPEAVPGGPVAALEEGKEVRDLLAALGAADAGGGETGCGGAAVPAGIVAVAVALLSAALAPSSGSADGAAGVPAPVARPSPSANGANGGAGGTARGPSS
jgi:hypothetical protein